MTFVWGTPVWCRGSVYEESVSLPVPVDKHPPLIPVWNLGTRVFLGTHRPDLTPIFLLTHPVKVGVRVTVQVTS